MKSLFEHYAAYNVWANHRIIYTVEQCDPVLWYQKTPSSFDSLYKTILHIWDAESAWWQRMRLHENIIVPSAAFDPSLKDACNGWLHQSMQWETFIKSDDFDEAAIASKLVYKNFKGDQFQQPVSEVLLHVFNHSTYHRGQLVTMLRALEISSIPVLDFIAWSRMLPGVSAST
ncbi:MAG: DinB family protein [Bacteroidota bacterium]